MGHSRLKGAAFLITIFLSLFAPAAHAQKSGAWYWGDGDGSGSIAGSDLDVLYQVIANPAVNDASIYTGYPQSRYRQDLDGNGAIGGPDANVLYGWLAGNYSNRPGTPDRLLLDGTTNLNVQIGDSVTLQAYALAPAATGSALRTGLGVNFSITGGTCTTGAEIYGYNIEGGATVNAWHNPSAYHYLPTRLAPDNGLVWVRLRGDSCTNGQTTIIRVYILDDLSAGVPQNRFSTELDAQLSPTNSTPVNFTITWSVPPPHTSIDSSPPVLSNSTDAAFSFSCDQPSCTYECDLDSLGWGPCSSPETGSALSDGSHLFSVRATSGGITDPTPPSWAWTIDTTPPDTEITAQPAALTNSTSASFSFTCTDAHTPCTFQCSIDSGAFTSCTSPANYSGLIAASHNFQVLATGAADNPDLSPASYTWTIDLTPPETQITANPPALSNSSSASFSFTCTDAHTPCTFQCSMDSGLWSSCSSPTTYSSLSSTSHTFSVSATDPAGNIETSPPSYTWIIEAKAGEITCGSVITTDITLTADLDCSGTGGDGLIIGADNITIDGNGHTITGTYSTPPSDFTNPATIQMGVKNLGHSGITIENLQVENFFIGIGEVGSSDSPISDITIENNTVTNNVLYELSFIFTGGIGIDYSDTNLVSGNQVEGFNTGISLTNATNNTVSSNLIINASSDGIDLSPDATETSTVTNNFIKWSSTALRLDNSAATGASVSGNTFLFNYQDIDNGGNNVDDIDVFTNNLSWHNINNNMISFNTEPAKNLHQGETASFAFNLEDEANNDCPSCTYSLTTSPSATITSALDGNTVSGSFVASKLGIYSLQISVADGSGNVSKRNLLFYVDTSGTSSLATAATTYYLRPGIDPVHGQPKGRDLRSMLLTAPTETEIEICSKWVDNTVDELPSYPFGTITGQNLNFWHKAISAGSVNIRRFINNFDDFIQWQDIDENAPDSYTFSNANFNDLNWNMDYPISWYNVTFEYDAPVPYVETTPAVPSTDLITHVYTTTPAIKFFSNPDALLLAANPSETGSPLATLTLDGTYIQGVGASHLVNVTLDNYKYPFDKARTEINSDGTATLVVSDLSDKETFASVPLTITPAEGYVDTTIKSWNSGAGGNYAKEWTEVASASGISVDYIVAQLAANTEYGIYVDGDFYAEATSDDSGVLSFDHVSSDSSPHDFSIIDL